MPGVSPLTPTHAFINDWNDHSHPLTWTKTTDEVLKNANQKKTTETDH